MGWKGEQEKKKKAGTRRGAGLSNTTLLIGRRDGGSRLPCGRDYRASSATLPAQLPGGTHPGFGSVQTSALPVV